MMSDMEPVFTPNTLTPPVALRTPLARRAAKWAASQVQDPRWYEKNMTVDELAVAGATASGALRASRR